MATVVEAVERCLETDLALHDALARGFLNVRRAARWLIQTHGWETTEEAVVSALRRYRPPLRADLGAARAALRASRLTASAGLTIIQIHEPFDVGQLLNTVRLSRFDTIALLPERKHLAILADNSLVPHLLEPIKKAKALAGLREVSRIEITFEGETPAAAAAVAVMIKVLCHRGIHLLAIYGYLPEVSFLVPDEQASDAYYAAVSLVRPKTKLH